MTIRIAAASLLAVCCLGCGEKGPPTGTVKGKLTIGGAVPTETIRVLMSNSMQGFIGAAATNPDGSFEINEPMRTGEYAVFLERIYLSNEPVSTAKEILTSVPKEYRREETTPLKTTVNEGVNTVEFDVPANKSAK